jgi:hypothetical protein
MGPMLTRSLVLLALAGTLAGCADDPNDPIAPAPSIEDVIYEGGANDEALEALLAAQPVADATKAAALVAPEDGAALDGAEPVEFSWALGAEGSRRRTRPLLRLARLFGGGPLQGHGAPVNGRAYFVVFHTAADEALVRVFTGLTTYTPAADAWQKMSAAGAPISVTITSGIYDNNLLAADGGPFVGDSATFTIEP